MSLSFKRISAFLLSFSLVACGGGGGGSNDGQSAGGQGPTSGGNSSGGQGASPPPAFSATLARAPADGETLNGTVTLEVRGSGIKNAELLPDTADVPRLGTFSINADNTVASLNLDTKTIPNGPVRLRIIAFNAPSGTAGASAITAMPARRWILQNDPAPTGTAEGRAAKCLQQGFPYTDMTDSLPVVCISAVPLSPPMEYAQCVANGYEFGTGYNDPGNGLPVLRDGRFISKLYCTPPAINGTVNPGCVCLQTK